MRLLVRLIRRVRAGESAAPEEREPDWLLQAGGREDGLREYPLREERSGAPVDAQRIRRLRDLGASILLTAVFWPLALLLAALIVLDSPGPALLRQRRVGYRGRPFTLYKFRTMIEGAEKHEIPIVDFRSHKFEPLKPPGRDPRVTVLGWVLRRTSLDELPQLLNVVKGDMSLVGPRPEMPHVVDLFPPEYHLRHEVKPGMTGLAQVNGLADITYHEKVMFDLEYVRKRSSALDLWILLRTAGMVLAKRGR